MRGHSCGQTNSTSAVVGALNYWTELEATREGEEEEEENTEVGVINEEQEGVRLMRTMKKKWTRRKRLCQMMTLGMV